MMFSFTLPTTLKLERGIFVQKYTATVEGYYGGKYETSELSKIIYLDDGGAS